MANHYIDNIQIVYTTRRLPAFEETHQVIGGCVVVERDPAWTGLALSGAFDDRFGAETRLKQSKTNDIPATGN